MCFVRLILVAPIDYENIFTTKLSRFNIQYPMIIIVCSPHPHTYTHTHNLHTDCPPTRNWASSCQHPECPSMILSALPQSPFSFMITLPSPFCQPPLVNGGSTLGRVSEVGQHYRHTPPSREQSSPCLPRDHSNSQHSQHLQAESASGWLSCGCSLKAVALSKR